MSIWLAAIAATLVQLLVLMAWIAYPLISSPDPAYGIGLLLLSVLAVGGAVVLLFGIPVFLLLRRFQRAGWTSLAIAGCLLGALPAALLGLPGNIAGFSAGQTWHGAYRETYVNGTPTEYAWLIYAEDVLQFAVHGLVGALVFYAVWSRLEARGRSSA